MNDKIKAELPDLIKDSANEILNDQRDRARARIKPVLEYKEAMDKSIADCERDLEKARKVRDDFAAKLADAEAGKFEALEEAEKIMEEDNPVKYQPATALIRTRTTFYLPPTYSYPASNLTITCGSNSAI